MALYKTAIDPTPSVQWTGMGRLSLNALARGKAYYLLTTEEQKEVSRKIVANQIDEAKIRSELKDFDKGSSRKPSKTDGDATDMNEEADTPFQKLDVKTQEA